MKILKILSTIFAIALSGCATQSQSVGETKLCDELHSFSKKVNVGNIRSVNFYIDTTELGIPRKNCEPSNLSDQSGLFCQWLNENTSAEFIQYTIADIMSCVTNTNPFEKRKIFVSSLEGDFKVHDPFDEIQNIDIDFKFKFLFGMRKPGNFFTISIYGVDKSAM